MIRDVHFNLLKTIFVAFFISASCFAAPAQVLILRHAEKIESTNHLSPKGYRRADALVKFFKNDKVANKYGPPVAIYAAYKEGSSLRSIETMTPTANYFHLRIRKDFKKKQTEDLVEDIMSNERYDGKTVIVCWQHTNIANILEEFDVADQAGEWPGNVFDQVIALDRLDGNTRYRVIPQKVLPGDHGICEDLLQ